MKSIIQKLAFVVFALQASSACALEQKEYLGLLHQYNCYAGNSLRNILRQNEEMNFYGIYSGLLDIQEKLKKASEGQKQSFAELGTMLKQAYSRMPMQYKAALYIKDNKVKLALIGGILAIYAWAKKYPQASVAGRVNQLGNLAAKGASWIGAGLAGLFSKAEEAQPADFVNSGDEVTLEGFRKDYAEGIREFNEDLDLDEASQAVQDVSQFNSDILAQIKSAEQAMPTVDAEVNVSEVIAPTYCSPARAVYVSHLSENEVRIAADFLNQDITYTNLNTVTVDMQP